LRTAVYIGKRIEPESPAETPGAGFETLEISREELMRVDLDSFAFFADVAVQAFLPIFIVDLTPFRIREDVVAAALCGLTNRLFE
jgi:hypothetical protein